VDSTAVNTSPSDVERRYANVRAALVDAKADALIACGTEYTGFEGAVRYLSGFRIVHRYAYVLLPLEGEPISVFPSEARWVGNHADGWVENRVFAEAPGQWMVDHLREQGARRIAVYGTDFIMPVRDYRALSAGELELIPFDAEFDFARAVKSDEEMELVRESMRINEAGFWAVHAAYQPGCTQAGLMAAAEAEFTRLGTGRQTMDMVLWGPGGSATPEFQIPNPGVQVSDDDMLLYSLEVAGPGGHWVEFSRPLCRGPVGADTQRMLEAYDEYYAAARTALHAGASAHDVHVAVSKPFKDRGFPLGHVTGHSIGMSMIEFPRIGEGVEVELQENMVLSMHPHAIAAGEKSCMYMQDTWRVGASEGEPLSNVALQVFDGSETRSDG
jgi:Xaa-Pro aminopeptidase